MEKIGNVSLGIFQKISKRGKEEMMYGKDCYVYLLQRFGSFHMDDG